MIKAHKEQVKIKQPIAEFYKDFENDHTSFQRLQSCLVERGKVYNKMQES
jgi:hypothetical protein